MLLSDPGKLYRAAIKTDKAKQRLYLLTLLEMKESLANRQVRNALKRIR